MERMNNFITNSKSLCSTNRKTVPSFEKYCALSVIPGVGLLSQLYFNDKIALHNADRPHNKLTMQKMTQIKSLSNTCQAIRIIFTLATCALLYYSQCSQLKPQDIQLLKIVPLIITLQEIAANRVLTLKIDQYRDN
jgi:hypothetical protein